MSLPSWEVGFTNSWHAGLSLAPPQTPRPNPLGRAIKELTLFRLHVELFSISLVSIHIKKILTCRYRIKAQVNESKGLGHCQSEPFTPERNCRSYINI